MKLKLNVEFLIKKIINFLFNLERMGVDISPQQRIEDMIRITELCIDLLKENEEHHGEVNFSLAYFDQITTYFLFSEAIFIPLLIKNYFKY